MNYNKGLLLQLQTKYANMSLDDLILLLHIVSKDNEFYDCLKEYIEQRTMRETMCKGENDGKI